MINLIPKEEKKRMTSDFYCRLLVLFFMMMSFSVFVASVLMLPAYFFSIMKDVASNTKLEMQKNSKIPALDEQSLAAIKDMNTKLDLVENAEKNKFSVSEKIINKILLDKTSDIKIVQISYQNDATSGKIVVILGTAPSRQALLAFEQALEGDSAFKNVNLPISNFVKESNLEFNLSLNPS
jgi:hypothetical protein